MALDIPLLCACGQVGGTLRSLSTSAGTRVVCYCDDCQAFARFLGRSDILDERGGTDIFQMAPSRLELAARGTLGCVRLSEKGMHRWYCTACKTPIGNTLGPKVPFVGVLHSCMAFGSARARDDVLGKPLARVQTKFASGAPVESDTLGTLRAVGRSVRLLATWWVTGAGQPSPFFDPRTREPHVAPRVLDPEERRTLARAASPAE